ncbi:MAG TPA: hypothetical protein VGQ76_13660 [Thermoanaerobaculia bacterium]|nr:hypothetical protein [Thermoanaerobaculia bacterium]
MDSWILKRNGNNVSVPDAATLRRWALAGYLKDGDLIFRPMSQQWVRPEDLPELEEWRRAAAEPDARVEKRLHTHLTIRQGDHEYRAETLEILQAWVNDGRILLGSTVFDEKSERWIDVRAFPGIAVPTSHAPLRVVEVARNYRHLVVWVGIQLLFSVWFALANSPAILAWPVLLASVLVLAYYAHETAKALGSSSALLWAAAMLMPCINIFTLLALSSRASAVCKANGIRVGFFGPEL